MNKLITIIIVTYNAEKYIGSALESLISRINEQTEIVIIDGLSTDNTINIINKFEKHISTFISEKDYGIYDAMNKGISIASGKYVLFLGADDQLIINLQELSNILIDNETIYYGDVILSPSDKIYGGKFNTAKLLNRNICHQSIFYPIAVFKEYQFENNYKLMEDYVMNLKLWASKKFKFRYINKTISVYSVEGLSSTNVDFAFKKDSLKIVFKYYGLVGLFFKFLNPIRNFVKF